MNKIIQLLYAILSLSLVFSPQCLYAQEKAIKLKPVIRIFKAQSQDEPKAAIKGNCTSAKKYKPNRSIVLAPKAFKQAALILALEDRHLLATCGSKFFARVCKPRRGALYYIYRPQDILKDEKGKCFFGQPAVFLAEAKIISCSTKGMASIFLITKSEQELQKGDALFLAKDLRKFRCE